MRSITVYGGLCGALLIVLLMTASARATGANLTVTNVTLANFTVDTVYQSAITDSPSNVTFSNPHTPAGSIFIIDYWNSSASLPDLTPGRVVSSNGYVGNGGISLPYDFGFTMSLPNPASKVDMIAAFSTQGAQPWSIAMNAYGSTGNLLGSSVFQPTTFASFAEAPLSFNAGSNLISSVSLVPTNVFDAFGHISFSTSVPEPATLGCSVAFAVVGLIRRRRGS